MTALSKKNRLKNRETGINCAFCELTVHMPTGLLSYLVRKSYYTDQKTEQVTCTKNYSTQLLPYPAMEREEFFVKAPISNKIWIKTQHSITKASILCMGFCYAVSIYEQTVLAAPF
jgi:hypothetical protein